MATLREYLEERKLTTRATILAVGLFGGLAGAILMFIFALLGLVS